MKYICSWSGGKDSTASIILAHLYGEPLDIILFSEVMFDLRRNISGENPEHICFIRNKAKPLFESWGYEVKILRAETDYLQCFNKIINNPRKNVQNKGKRRGFAISGLCGIKRDCKEKPIKEFYKNLNEEYVQYVGICTDEPKRLESIHKAENKVSLLEKYGYSQDMARNLCKQHDLLSPSYNLSKRGGCWFCPNAKLAEHKAIKELYPQIWKDFVELENLKDLSADKFNPYGMTLHEIDELLEFESQQMTIFDFLK